MKDLIIKEKTLKREIFVLVSLFIISVLLNIYAIIIYDGSFIEIFTQIGWVVAITFLLYIIWLVLQLFFNLIKCAWKKAKS